MQDSVALLDFMFCLSAVISHLISIHVVHRYVLLGILCKYAEVRLKNFVFDHRRAERISDDVIAKCHQLS